MSMSSRLFERAAAIQHHMHERLATWRAMMGVERPGVRPSQAAGVEELERRVYMSGAGVVQSAPVALIGSTGLTLAAEAPVNSWTGGATGTWGTAGNWSLGRVPDVGDQVTIPAGVTVEIAASTTLGDVQCDGSLSVTAGTLTIWGNVYVAGGFVMSAGTVLRGEGAGAHLLVDGTSQIDDTSLYATAGATLALPGVTSFRWADGIPTWQAAGAGSVLDLSGLTDWVGQNYGMYVRADAGGQVKLPAITSIANASALFIADGVGSLVDLPNLTQYSPAVGSSAELTALNEGEIRVPQLVTLQRIRLSLQSGGQMATSQLTSVTDGSITVDSVRDFGHLTNINGTSLVVTNGATLALPGVTSYRWADGIPTWQAAGAGSVLDLSGLTDWVGQNYGMYIWADGGGRVDLSAVQQIANSCVLFKAEGAGSVLDLTKLTGIAPASGSYAELIVRNAGTIVVATAGCSLVRTTIGGAGTIQGSITSSGTVSLPAGQALTITGDYRQLPSGRMEVAVNTAGQIGTMGVGGVAMLSGTLAVSGATSLTPSVGTIYSVVSAQSVVGLFSTATGWETSGAGDLTVDYTGTTVVLKAIADGGAIDLGSEAKGKVFVAGETDEWTFTGRAGQQYSVFLTTHPGSVAPFLDWGQVVLLAPDGSEIARADNHLQTAGGMVRILGVTAPANGVYRVRILAADDHSDATGRYRLLVASSRTDSATLIPNQQLFGNIETPQSVDNWTFSLPANTQVQFDRLSAASAGILFNLTGPTGIPVFTDLAGSSSPITLTLPGTYTLRAHGQGDTTGVYSFRLRVMTVQTISLGTSFTQTISGPDQLALYRFDSTNGNPLTIDIADGTASDVNEVSVRFGAPPTTAEYDYRSSGMAANQLVMAASGRVGTWYVLVQTHSNSGAGSYSIRAEAPAMVVQSMTPERVNSGAQVQFLIRGAGFTGDVTAKLVVGGVDHPLTLTVDGWTQMQGSVSLAGIPAGTATLVITRGGTSVSRPVTIAPAAQGRFESHLTLPSSLGYHGVATIWVEYTNSGDAPIPAPFLAVGSGDPEGDEHPFLTLDQHSLVEGFWTSATPAGFSESVLIYATGAVPGVLSPGETVRVPVYYAGMRLPWSTTDRWFEFNTATYTQDSTEAIDWAEVQSWFTMPGVDPIARELVFSAVRAQIGETWGGYVRALSEDAQYLHRLGRPIGNAESLWAFEVNKVAGLISPVGQIASSVDASMLVRAGSITLGRSFGSTVAERYFTGMFGRGWYTPWDMRISAETDGTMNIIGAEGLVYRFKPDGRVPQMVVIGPVGAPPEPPDVVCFPADDGSRLSYAEDRSWAVLSTTYGANIYFNVASGRIYRIESSNGFQANVQYFADAISITSGTQLLRLELNSQGRVTTATTSSNEVTRYTYDAAGEHLLTVQYPDGQTVSYTYEATPGLSCHALRTITTPSGASEEISYDARGRVVGAAFMSGGVPRARTTFRYSSAGQVSQYLLNGASEELAVDWFMDENGELAAARDSVGDAIHATRDTLGNIVNVIDALGQSINLTYNNIGLPVTLQDELGNVTRFAYGPMGLLALLTDARGNQMRFGYDSSGNMVSTTYADGSAECWSYDGSGNVTSYTNRRGQTIRYSYNIRGLVLSRVLPDGTRSDYAYDASDNLVSITDSTGVTAFQYDAGHRLTRVTYPNGRWVAYQYNSDGQRTRIEDSTGAITRYVYDGYGFLHEVRNGANVLQASYTYDSRGWIARVDKGNGTYTTYAWNAAGQLLRIANCAPGGSLNSQFDYSYDLAGRVAGMVTLEGTWTYGYDAAGQLVSAIFASNNVAVIPNQDLRYVYDALGNRIQTTINGVVTSYLANNLNEYTNIGGVSQSYDADGNLVSSGDGATYTYNVLGQMTGMHKGADTWSFEYDALGSRVAQVLNGVRTEYLVDPTGMGNVLGEFGPGGTLTAQYTHAGTLLSERTGSTSYFYDADALGSIAGLTGPGGAEVNTYAYRPYGERLLDSETVSNPFEFVGGYGVMEAGSDMDFMRARYYSDATGRFDATDPLGLGGGGGSLYRYGENRPADMADPSGMVPEWLFAFGTGADANLRAHTDRLIEDQWKDPMLRNPRIKYDPKQPFSGALGSRDAQLLIPYVYDRPRIGNDLVDLINLLNPWNDGSYTPPLHPPFIHNRHSTYDDLFLDNPDGPRGKPGNGGPGGHGSNSEDPNEKLSPAGFGTSHFIRGNGGISYQINCENDKDATGPAQYIVVEDTFDANLDLTTFELTEIGFGDVRIGVPAGSGTSYSTSVSVTQNGISFDVQIIASLDLTGRKLTVRFYAVDPATQLPPDASVGVLPPEDGTGRGMGFVSFIVKPKAGLASGTEIRNIARISFDAQDWIYTNQIDPHDPSQGTDPDKECLNTIDGGAPTSHVEAIAATSSSLFVVSWSGADDAGGSGIASIASYDVYYRDNTGAWTLWLGGTTLSSAAFAGLPGHRYRFYSIARDNVGHTEAAPEVYDAQVVAGSELVIRGTDAADTISVSATASDLLWTIGGQGYSVPLSSLTAITIEVLGGDDAVTIAVGVGGVTILGGDGNDTLSGGRAADRIEGGAGDDSIRGDDGADTIYGGAGNDTIMGNTGDDSLAGEDGADQIQAGLGYDFLAGGLGNDSLYAGDQMDTVHGDEGDDYIEGRGKADTIWGGAGNDTILGGAGSDLIYAEDGDDRIWVGLSAVFADSVDGGAGNDASDGDANDVLSSVESVLA